MTSRLSEVAQYAGVSEATVSRVLNDKPGVAASTREAVLTALDVLGYERPTQLRRRRSNLVGLVVPELHNPIFPAFAEVIGGALAQRGFTPVLCTRTRDPRTRGGVPEDEDVEMLLEHQVSGVVFVCGLHSHVGADHGHYRRLLDRGLPVVAINGIVEGLHIPCVSTDDALGVELAMRHVLSLGHERIGLALGGADHVQAARKVTAFREAMRRHLGVAETEQLTEHSMYTPGLEGGVAAASRLLQHGVTAVLCASDLMALGAVRAVRRLGLDVPGDVSVVGYDDSMFMPLTDPALTTIRQPVESMGEAAVAVLMSQISGSSAPHEELLFDPELVVRASTGVCPGGRLSPARATDMQPRPPRSSVRSRQA